MQRQYPIRIYTTYKNQIPKMSFVQHDTEVNRIYFEFYDDMDKPMTGIYTATLTVKRADGKTYTYGMNNDGRPVFIIENNFVTVILPPGAVFSAGECQASISLYDTDMGRLTTQTFKYTVTAELISDTPIDETDNYPILTDLLNEVELLKNTYQGAIDGSVVAQDHIEIVNARKGEATLKDKIDNIDATIVSINTELDGVDSSLAEKVKQSYLNAVFINVINPPIPLAPLLLDGTDETVKFQAIINYLSSGGIIEFPTGKKLGLSSTIKIPQNIDIDFKNCTVNPITGGAFINNYMFCINASNGVSWDLANPSRVGYFRNLNIDNRNVSTPTPRVNNVKGILVGCPYKVSNIWCNFLWQTISTTGDYIDNLEWETFSITNPQGTEYQVRKVGQGDRCRIAKMDLVNYLDNGVTNNYGYLLEVHTTQGTMIEGIVNGINLLDHSTGVTLSNIHCERGFWKVTDSCFAIRDSYFWKDDINSGLTIVDSEHASGVKWGTAKPSILENVIFNLRFNDYNYVNNIPDIDTTNFRGYLNIKACYRRSEPVGMPYNRLPISGVSVKTPNGVINLPFNNNNIVDGELEKVNVKCVSTAVDDGYYLLTATGTQTGITWQDVIGTYHYRVGIIYDLIRMIGVINGTTGASAVTLADTTNAVKLTLSKFRGNGILRVYKGTSAGQYNKYVDVPNVIASMLFDNGKNIQGYVWQSRTAGVVDTVNNYTGIQYIGDNVLCYGTAIPTVGTWTKGDKIINSNPAVGQPKGWVCTVAGTPGTWVSEGNL